MQCSCQGDCNMSVRAGGTCWCIMDAASSTLTSTGLPFARRADAGSVRLGGRDVAGLMLVGDMYGAPYDLLAGWDRARRGAG